MIGRNAILAFALLAASAVMAALGLVFTVLNGFGGSQTVVLVVFAFYGACGALIAIRAGGNLVGWLLISIAVSSSFAYAADQYAVFAYVHRSGDMPLAPLAAWISMWLFLGTLAPLAIVLFLFPDGRLPSPRWRAPLGAVVAVLAMALVAFAFGTEASQEHPEVRNPLLVPPLIPLYQFVQDAFVLYLTCFGLGVASLVARYRRAGVVERHQLKWIAVTTAFILVGLIFSHLTPELSILNDVSWLLSLSALPVVVAISILRYRLYDIDVVIERTLVYAVLTAVLGATYVAAVIASQALLGPLIGGNELSIAMSTLLVIALFQPLRRRVQRGVDHRFYRGRYDAQRVLDAFSSRLRDEIDLGALEHELVTVVGRTVRPAHASVWIRDRG